MEVGIPLPCVVVADGAAQGTWCCPVIFWPSLKPGSEPSLLLVRGLKLFLFPQVPVAHPNHAASQAFACVSIFQTGLVVALAHVVFLLVDHDGSAQDGVRAEQSGEEIRFVFSDFAIFGREVPKIPRVAGVVDAEGVVVSSGGVAAVAEIPKLVDVNSSAGLGVIQRKPVQVKNGFQSSLRVMLSEQDLSSHLWLVGIYFGAGLHLTSGVGHPVGLITGHYWVEQILPEVVHFLLYFLKGLSAWVSFFFCRDARGRQGESSEQSKQQKHPGNAEPAKCTRSQQE